MTATPRASYCAPELGVRFRMDVAVVIPVFNKERHVERAIRSALSQTLSPAKVVIVDDASTDGSRERIAAISDPRVTVIHRQTPGPGGYAARNAAINAVTTEWIAFLDVDLVAYAGTADVRGVIVAGQSGDPLRQRSLWSKVQHTPQRLGQFILQQHIGEPMPFVRPAPWTFRIEPEEGTRLYGEELKPGPSAQGTLTPLCEAKETRDDQLVCATGGGRHMSHASMIGELRTSELLSAFYG